MSHLFCIEIEEVEESVIPSSSKGLEDRIVRVLYRVKTNK